MNTVESMDLVWLYGNIVPDHQWQYASNWPQVTWGKLNFINKQINFLFLTMRSSWSSKHKKILIFLYRHFEFRLCPNAKAKQDCLDKYLLELLGGSPSVPQPNDLKTRFYPRNGSRIYEIKAKLPEGKCWIFFSSNFAANRFKKSHWIESIFVWFILKVWNVEIA